MPFHSGFPLSVHTLHTHTLGPPCALDFVAGILWAKCFLPINLPAGLAGDFCSFISHIMQQSFCALQRSQITILCFAV
jgi:hypothetical protein